VINGLDLEKFKNRELTNNPHCSIIKACQERRIINMKIRVKYEVENIIEVDDKFEKLCSDYDDELEDELWEFISNRQIDLISGDQSVRMVEDLYGVEIFL
jgi:hypothetical protein